MSDHEDSGNHGNDGNHGNSRRNGLRANHDNQMEDVVIAEEDLVEIVDNREAPDVAEELDMLDLAELDPDRVEADPDDDDADPEEEDSPMMLTPERDDAQLVFSEHRGSVFCVGVGQSSLAVTGGEDDKAFVWDTTTGESIMTCTGHKDSVTMVGFSQTADLVATGDLSGFIQVWDLSNKQAVSSFEVSDLEWLSWHHSAPILLAGTVDGDIWMWKIPGHETKTFQSFGSACNLAKVLPDGKRVVAGYGDGSIRVWDLKTATVTHTLTGQNAHTKSVTSMSCHNDNALALTGSTDGSALLINTVTGKVISRFECSRQPQTPGEEDGVESVGLSNTSPFAATGTLRGSLDIWDIPTQICRQHCTHEAGVVKLLWDDTQPLVYTSSLDGVVRLWDARNGCCEREWMGHEAAILDVQILRNDGKIITTSDDHTARVFSL